MKRFFKRIVLLVCIIVFILFISALIQRGYAWRITNSVSMNAKLSYADKMNAEDLDIIGIGSSMTLNNLNSEAFVNSLPENVTFFNYAAWGVTMEDNCIVLQNLLQTSEPKSVILFSNIVDFFDENGSQFQGEDLKNYMDGKAWNDVILAVKYAFPNNIVTMQEYKAHIKDRNFYSTLLFDEYGGVPLEVYGDSIDETRWNILLEEDNVQERQYQALEELCQLAKAVDIELYFVQTPSRYHYLSAGGMNYLESHKKRCQEIIEKYGQNYYDATDFEKYDDSLFADYIHLNREGSELLTEEFVDRYMTVQKQCE